MLAIAFLFFFLLYLALSVGLVWSVVRLARKYGYNKWIWGSITATVMYLTVFWDHIPTVVQYQHLCDTQAGYWVYKTPEEWIKENPGILETLNPYRVPKELTTSRGLIFQENDRFGRLSETEKVSWLPIRRRMSLVIDLKTDEVISKVVDFNSGYGSLVSSKEGNWKLWLSNESCILSPVWMHIQIQNNKFIYGNRGGGVKNKIN